jgi:thiol-disulfide isomerase/thioredoxin
MKLRSPLFLLLLLIVTSCARRPMPQSSIWNGGVDLAQGKVLPFRMDLDFSSATPSGYFIVGDEKTPIPEISRNGNELVLRFSEYGAEMRATWDGRQLSGAYRRIRSSGTKSFSFRAEPAEGSPKEPVLDPSLASAAVGNYQVLFQREDKVDDSTVAKLWIKDGVLYGTFIAPDGDYGLLVGEPSGMGIHLNRFTGWQATIITLEQSAGTWTGEFYAASNDKPRPFILQPRADLNVVTPPTFRTSLKNPNSEFTFSGVSLTGETIRNTDDRFKGKALIVDIMGTWCHNCLDEAPVLQQLQQQFGKDGLEIVGLSFEISDDPALAKKNLELFKDRFGLTYTLLFCGSLDDDNVNKQIKSQIDNFFAYPTAIFIDKLHKVQTIHSGFKGPGTGEEFQKQIADFQELAGRLVAAPGKSRSNQ